MDSETKNKIKRLFADSDYRFLILNSRGFYKWMSDEKCLKKLFKIKLGYDPNLDNPQSFNEKLQWLKIHDRRSIYTIMVDKYAVKQYVADRTGGQYIVPNYGVWESFDEIDFQKLPAKFVLKCTHDSGGIVICDDKALFNIKMAKKKLNRSLRRNYFWVEREWPYKNVKRKIIAEEYMENDSLEGLHDYKVWCFNGDAKYVQYITGRSGENTNEGFFDKEWKLQPFTYHNSIIQTEVAKPVHLEKLFDIANKLSKGIPFARVDFYILPDDSIRFGEITLYPMGGTEHWHPDEMDRILGDMITLPIEN